MLLSCRIYHCDSSSPICNFRLIYGTDISVCQHRGRYRIPSGRSSLTQNGNCLTQHAHIQCHACACIGTRATYGCGSGALTRCVPSSSLLRMSKEKGRRGLTTLTPSQPNPGACAIRSLVTVCSPSWGPYMLSSPQPDSFLFAIYT